MVEWGSQPSLSESKVFTFTIVHVGFGSREGKTPYCLAIIENQKGEKETAILEDVVDFSLIKIGIPVKLKRTDETWGEIYSPAFS